MPKSEVTTGGSASVKTASMIATRGVSVAITRLRGHAAQPLEIERQRPRVIGAQSPVGVHELHVGPTAGRLATGSPHRSIRPRAAVVADDVDVVIPEEEHACVALLGTHDGQ